MEYDNEIITIQMEVDGEDRISFYSVNGSKFSYSKSLIQPIYSFAISAFILEEIQLIYNLMIMGYKHIRITGENLDA